MELLSRRGDGGKEVQMRTDKDCASATMRRCATSIDRARRCRLAVAVFHTSRKLERRNVETVR